VTAWHLLPVTFALCALGAALSYTDLRRCGGYVPAMAALGAGCAALYAVGAKWLDDKGKVYVFGLTYDGLVLVAYYVLPLALFGARVRPGVLAGAALVAAGLVVAHASGE
jgi:hypothetical protein